MTLSNVEVTTLLEPVLAHPPHWLILPAKSMQSGEYGITLQAPHEEAMTRAIDRSRAIGKRVTMRVWPERAAHAAAEEAGLIAVPESRIMSAQVSLAPALT